VEGFAGGHFENMQVNPNPGVTGLGQRSIND